jgi:hypothetical protein
MRWPLPVLLVVLGGCAAGPSANARAVHKQVADEIAAIRVVLAKAKLTTTSASGMTVKFNANCTFVRGGIVRIVPLDFGIGVFDATVIGSAIMTQVVGGDTDERLIDLAYDTVDPIAWWTTAPAEVFGRPSYAVNETPHVITFTAGQTSADVDPFYRKLAGIRDASAGQSIGFSGFVRVRNEAAASYKPEVPQWFDYPSLITIETKKIRATLELSDIRINAPIPPGTLPKAFEDLAK